LRKVSVCYDEGVKVQKRVVVIGGGGTGAASAYDLALRGVAVTLLERGELGSGTTGRHHGQLHSGARYAVADRAIARECMAETLTLRRIAGDCLEFNGGLFVSLPEDDASYGNSFLEACGEAGIPVEEIPISRALTLAPALNPAIRRALLVPDGSFDAFRLMMRFFAAARLAGADIRPFNEVVGVKSSDGQVASVEVLDRSVGTTYTLQADAVLIAAGPWSSSVGALAGVDIPVTAAPGAMVAVEGRLSDLVLSRLRPPSDGDILVPQRRLSIIGSTQRDAADPDGLSATEDEVRALLGAGDELIPGFSSRPIRAAWAAARPLAGRPQASSSPANGPESGLEAARAISRDLVLYDHGRTDGVAGLFSMLGGKATTLRAMGELAADSLCAYLGIEAPCQTRDRVLPQHRSFWTGEGL